MRVYQFRHVGLTAKPRKTCCNREDRIIRQLDSFGQSKLANLFHNDSKQLDVGASGQNQNNPLEYRASQLACGGGEISRRPQCLIEQGQTLLRNFPLAKFGLPDRSALHQLSTLG
ncbi:hypothetical protein [Collimonas pratensis]|uniref:hypothetical protein n=1 Tax=Collimonas pratensis TaxID=279113 RepID=UPI0012E81CAA|nr:hypothetical protein [Collimonas pratensis]